MKHARYCWLLLTAWCLLAGAGLAQEPPASLSYVYAFDAFRLWNECAPIGLVVEELPDDAAEIDLMYERIQTLAESRLRVARLYDAAVPLYISYLYVRVGVIVSENRRSGAFTIEVSFKKDVLDVVSDRNGSAVTWATTIYGIHAGDADYIMQLRVRTARLVHLGISARERNRLSVSWRVLEIAADSQAMGSRGSVLGS